MDGHERKLMEFNQKFKDIEHFFDEQAVKDHLIFLKAFVRVAEVIDSNFAVKDPSTGIKSPSTPMNAYLSQAVSRYHIWITKGLKGRPEGPLALDELPPLDVLFILHAHMIAPSRFDEDVTLHFPELGKVGPFPLSNVVSRIDIESGRYGPLPAQVETWQRLTGLPFDLATTANPLDVSGLPSLHHLSPPFSTDLVYKAILQADFGTRLGRRGWLEQSFLLRNKGTLATRLYQAFLKLILFPNMPRIFPSPPVDLIWHTHQLLGVKYKLQVLDLVGVFVDHLSMDQIAPTETEFDKARTAWMAFLKAEGVPTDSLCLEFREVSHDQFACTASGSQRLPVVA